MSFKFMKTSVALASAASLAAFGLVAAPAQAADGDVVLKPLSGSGYSAFVTDNFEFEIEVASTVSPTTLAYRIDNPEQLQLHIKPGGNSFANFSAYGIKSDGTTTEAGAGLGTGHDAVNFGDGIVVDFDTLDIVSLVIYGFDSNGRDGNTLSVQVDKQTTVTNGSETGQTVTPLVYADTASDESITVSAWIETGATANPNTDATKAATAHATVDSLYSDSQVVTFVNPSDVVPVTAIERMAQVDELGAGQTTLDDVLFVDGVRSANEIENIDPDADGGLVDTDEDNTLSVGDVILAFDSNSTSSETGIYTAGASGNTTSDLDDLADQTIVDLATGDVYTGAANDATKSTSVTASGVAEISTVIAAIRYFDDPDLTATGDIEDGSNSLSTDDVVLVVDTNDGSKTAVYEVNDAAVPTVLVSGDQMILKDAFMAKGDESLAGTLKFSNPNINLAQVDLAKWLIEVESTSSDDRAQADLADSVVSFTPNGHSDVDGLGRLAFSVAPATGLAALVESKTYNLAVAHDGATSTKYKSPGFQVVASTEGEANNVAASVDDSDNVSIEDETGNKYPTKVRNGTASVQFDGQVYSAGDTKLKEANIPFLAVVTAGSAFPKGETLTVSGTNQKVETSSASVVTTGVTDSDGEFSVTVTSSDTSAAGTKYDVQFYVLDGNTDDVWRTAHEDSGNALYQIDYEKSAIDTFGTTPTVASGSSITLSFDVEDQFGEALSETSKGVAYSVELAAPDTDDLELYAQVENGTATFTFDNYLTAGESDVLTAKLYEGTSTSPKSSDFVSGQTDNITIYGANNATGINVTEEVTGVDINYTDFFDGKVGGANQTPSATAATLTGTVVDANGAGVPGAPVTVSAEGFMFEVGGVYATDTMTTIATASGAFEVDFYSTVLSGPDGVDITVTSGDLSATTSVVTELPDTLQAGDVRLSWQTPDTVVTNTTYAVTATLVDIWGNPIAGQDLAFRGLAAAQFNSKDEVERVTGSDGTAIAYLRSVKDVDGLSAIEIEIDSTDTPTGVTTFTDVANTSIKDDTKTSWDESLYAPLLDEEINFLKTAPAAADAKVNAGSFKGYVAVYAKGYEGQRLSAKIGNDWVVVPALASSFERIVDFTGAGVDIAVRIYIDRVLMDTINLTTK